MTYTTAEQLLDLFVTNLLPCLTFPCPSYLCRECILVLDLAYAYATKLFLVARLCMLIPIPLLSVHFYLVQR